MLVVAAKFRIEDSLLLVRAVVPMRAAPFRDGLEGPSEALLHRLDMDRELPSPAERTLMRQPPVSLGRSYFTSRGLFASRATPSFPSGSGSFWVGQNRTLLVRDRQLSWVLGKSY